MNQLKVAFGGRVCKMDVDRLSNEDLLEVYLSTAVWARAGIQPVDFEKLQRVVLQRMEHGHKK